MATRTQHVVLIGKVGHGKSSMLNKVCGARVPIGMGAKSVTEHIQLGWLNDRLAVIDTPGFFSSTHVAGHVAAQKVALEGVPLSGIFLVVKYGRADDIAELANTIMDVIGCDDIRIAITHEDVAASQTGFDSMELRRTLSSTLDIAEEKIYSFGKTTESSSVKSFITANLHAPLNLKLSGVQVGQAAALGVGSRKLNKPINAVYAKIKAAEVACRDAQAKERGYESDYLITSTQNATTIMVQEAKRNLFEAVDDFTEEQQHLMYGKAGVSLSLHLKTFIETTNNLLSYDVTDTSNPNNICKKCNYCGAVWIKTEGCNGTTVCGAVPSAVTAPRIFLRPEFVEENGAWTLYFLYGCDSTRRSASDTWTWFKSSNPFRKLPTNNKGSGTNHLKRARASFESGCGATIKWSTMNPVPPEELLVMKNVDMMKESSFPEESAKVRFENKVREMELENKSILMRF